MSIQRRRPRRRATRASSWKWPRTGAARWPRLQEASRAEGGTPADYGSAAATLHRRLEDLRVALGGGDKAIIKEVERGEDYLKEEFERVLNDDRMSPGAMAAVREAFESVRRGHDEASDLKHRLEATD